MALSKRVQPTAGSARIFSLLFFTLGLIVAIPLILIGMKGNIYTRPNATEVPASCNLYCIEERALKANMTEAEYAYNSLLEQCSGVQAENSWCLAQLPAMKKRYDEVLAQWDKLNATMKRNYCNLECTDLTPTH